MRAFCGRILGWAPNRTDAVEHAIDSIYLSVGRDAVLVLLGDLPRPARHRPQGRVLLMSGHTLNEQVQEILDLGVRSFVSEPYSIAQLATAMAELTR